MTPIVSRADLDLSNIIDQPRSRRKAAAASPATTPSKRRGKAAAAAGSNGTPSSSTRKGRKIGGEHIETSSIESDHDVTKEEKGKKKK